MNKLFATLEAKKAFKAKLPATEDEIKKAECLLDLTFAKDYKDYLSQYGQAVYYGHELTGITSLSRLNVITVTEEERLNNPDIPDNFYVIEQAQIDDIVIWQSSTGEIFQSQPGEKTIKMFKSLIDYIENY